MYEDNHNNNNDNYDNEYGNNYGGGNGNNYGGNGGGNGNGNGNGGGNTNINCADVEGRFRLKRNGEFINCGTLLTNAYAGKCNWYRMQKKCPDTCGVSCTDIQTRPTAGATQTQTNNNGNNNGNNNNGNNNNGNNNNNNINNDPMLISADEDDFFGNFVAARVCRDVGYTFKLGQNGSRIRCEDLLLDRYKLACTWQSVKDKW